MYAIIKQDNGKYYTSTVFGYFHDMKSKNDYCYSSEEIHSQYYVVWNPDKTALVKIFALQPNTRYLIPQILIVDIDKSNWNYDENTEMGCVNFLTRELADQFTESGFMPQAFYEKCIHLENEFDYDPCPEIKTQKDIENLEMVSGSFHDSRIDTCNFLEDGTLYVRFSGMWGCDMELWFWDEVSYCIDSRDPEFADPYWYSSSIFFQNEYIYLVDEENMTAEEINEHYCWFKAKHMKYRVIPN